MTLIPPGSIDTRNVFSEVSLVNVTACDKVMVPIRSHEEAFTFTELSVEGFSYFTSGSSRAAPVIELWEVSGAG